MLDQIGEQLAAPADAAFEKPKMHVREAPRHAAEEQRLGHGMPGGGEMADVVVGEIARAIAQPQAAAAGVEGRRHLQLAAFLPDRVVIVVAVETELVVMGGEASDFGFDALGSRKRATDAAAEHADLRAELPGNEFELLDRLLGSMHR